MTAKEYNETIVSKCKKCSKWLYCKKHQAMWFKLVEQSPRPFKSDEVTQKFMKAFNGIITKI